MTKTLPEALARIARTIEAELADAGVDDWETGSIALNATDFVRGEVEALAAAGSARLVVTLPPVDDDGVDLAALAQETWHRR